jgi:PAS domain S-box-containing protein
VEQYARILDGMLATSPDHVFMFDCDGRFLYASRNAARDMGLERQSIVGKTWRDFGISDEMAEEFDRRCKRVFSAGKISKNEFFLKTVRGFRHYEYILAPIRGKHNIDGIVATARDITDRKRMEKEVRISHERLKSLASKLEQVREEERTAISRELHDELGQILSGLRMDLSWLLKRLPEENKALIDKTAFMLSYMEPAIDMIRRISTDLRPGILDDLGLIAAVEWQVQIFRKRTGIDCRLETALEEANLGTDLKTALFRIVQESLTNISKHAAATKVFVSLKSDKDQVALRIEDNGKGVKPSDLRKTKSMGILGMKERISILEGKFSIQGVPGKGTFLSVWVPMRIGKGSGKKTEKSSRVKNGRRKMPEGGLFSLEN